MLFEVFTLLKDFCMPRTDNIVAILQGLTTIPRFETAIMFLENHVSVLPCP
jgi:hypothetical protein